MKPKMTIILAFLLSLWSIEMIAQERDYSIFSKSEKLELQSLEALIEEEAKAELKKAVKTINTQLDNDEISEEDAEKLKTEAADESAKNIEELQDLLYTWASYQKRNFDKINFDDFEHQTEIDFLGKLGFDREYSFSLDYQYENDDDSKESKKPLKERDLPYTTRTHNGIFWSFSFNNAVLDGGNIDDTPFKFAGSRSFEIGYEWSTRVFKETNFLRIKYGFSFQFNGLKPKSNSILIEDGEQTGFVEADVDLEKSKFRMDNLIIPVHLQFGTSKTTVLDNGNKRFDDQKFIFGIGGFVGANLLNTQKLKYTEDGENVKLRARDDYNTNDLLYGLSAYAGIGDISIFAQYNLNPVFKNNPVDLNNFQIGLRFTTFY